MTEKQRCPWALSSPLAMRYHDEEWGVPVHDDAVLFEFITLEGAQAGLSWDTVLRKRERYREVFAHFDRDRVARFTPARLEKILADPGVIRHRGKIESVVSNAKALRAIAAEFGSVDAYLWGLCGGKPLLGSRKTFAEEPPLMPLAERLSADLRKRGLRFVGPTIVYAFMQAVGIVNDHLPRCFRRNEVDRPAATRRRSAAVLRPR
jgi:DNA-3-methyladenine glycosylase I